MKCGWESRIRVRLTFLKKLFLWALYLFILVYREITVPPLLADISGPPNKAKGKNYNLRMCRSETNGIDSSRSMVFKMAKTTPERTRSSHEAKDKSGDKTIEQNWSTVLRYMKTNLQHTNAALFVKANRFVKKHLDIK